MTNHIRLGALALVILGAPSTWAVQRQVFRTETKVVPLYVTVRDDGGRFVPNLDRDEFRVLVDGRPAEISLLSIDPQALSVAVMLDASSSFGAGLQAANVASHLREALLAFVRGLGPRDRASLGSFGTEIAVGANLTRDVQEFERILREEYWTGAGAGTPLWQAIDEAIAALSAEPHRRVVLVYTDGYDSGPLPHWKGNRRSVERHVLSQDGMVYIVRLGTAETLPDAIASFAETTGGGYREVATGDDMELVSAQLLEELRHQYLLGIAPAVWDGKEHSVEVRMARSGWKAYSRRKYIAGGSR